MEYRDAPFKTGNFITGVNPFFVGLTENLTSAGSGPPVLRIGGGSADEIWWNPERRRPRPFGVLIDITPAYTDAFAAFRARAGTPFILGLNFLQNDPALAVELAREFTNRLPAGAIKAFEVGNEPDIYFRRSLGTDANGRTVLGRPKGYGLREYTRELGRFLTPLRRLRPRPRLAGPAAACTDDWCSELPRILRRHGRRLDLVTYHSYPLHACNRRPGSRNYPTIAQLLSDQAIRRVGPLAFTVAASRRHRLPVRISETNSAACGGAIDVSNTFAASLWSVDWLFALAAIGMTGVDFHSSAPLYAPFATNYVDGQWVGSASPLYYGMLLFSRATANRARLLFDATLGTRLSTPAKMRLWATIDRRRTVRVVVLNKESRRRGRAQIQIPGARGRATLVRLRARGLRSREVTLAGQTIPRPSTDGRLQGDVVSTQVRPRRGVYRFSMPAGSAAMLTVDRVRRRSR